MNRLFEYRQNIIDAIGPTVRPWLDKGMDRWDELNNREQLVVSLLAVCIILALFIVLLVHPLIQHRAQNKAQYESQLEQLVWMRSVAPQLKGQGSNAAPVLNAQSMMNTVNQNAAAFQLKLDRVQPEGGNKLRVWMQGVSFNALMEWLNDLQLNSGIVPSSVSIDDDSSPGMVSARVVLEGL